MDEESSQGASDGADPVAAVQAALRRAQAAGHPDAEIAAPQTSELAKIGNETIVEFVEKNPDILARWIANWDSEKREILTRWSELMYQYRVSEDPSQRDFYNFLFKNADTITLEHAKHLTLHLRPAKKKGGRKPGQNKYEEDDKWAEIEILARWLKDEEITAVVKDVAQRAAGKNTAVASRERRLWKRLKAKGWS